MGGVKQAVLIKIGMKGIAAQTRSHARRVDEMWAFLGHIHRYQPLLVLQFVQNAAQILDEQTVGCARQHLHFVDAGDRGFVSRDGRGHDVFNVQLKATFGNFGGDGVG